MRGTHLCYHHGGPTPRGIAAPTYKHGRYSKAIPPAIRDKYDEVRGDEDYLSLRDNIALVSALIMQTLEGMERGEAGALWVSLNEVWDQIDEARQTGDTGRQSTLLNDARSLTRRGYREHMARLEVERQSVSLSRLVDAEGKRLERAQATVTVERAMALIRAIAESVRRNVSDPKTLSTISRDILALIGGGRGALDTPGNG